VLQIDLPLLDQMRMQLLGVVAAPPLPVGNGPLVIAKTGHDRRPRSAVAE
jgi:hypothetical protein